MELSNPARAWLRKRREEQGFGPNKCYSLGPVLKEIVRFCQERSIDVGSQEGDKHFRFKFAALKPIREACDFTIDLTKLNRTQAANYASNEKLAGENPRDYRILAAFKNHQLSDVYKGQQINIELDIRELDLQQFSHLVAVENRDSFNDWHKFKLEKPFTNPLVVYRGDNEEGKWFAYLRALWQADKTLGPSVYFGDFDLAAMRWAIPKSGPYAQLLLPSREALLKLANSAHYQGKQMRFIDSLEKDCPAGWRSLLDVMTKEQKALRQQNMYEGPLVCFDANSTNHN